MYNNCLFLRKFEICTHTKEWKRFEFGLSELKPLVLKKIYYYSLKCITVNLLCVCR